jgi:cytoskeletal protein RodZ
MAGHTLPPASIGVGPALRRARAIREISQDDASRDTKLRVEQLRALEEEDFDALGGDVYARAALRTYAQYLGLNADKVIRIYGRHTDEPAPPPPPGKLGRVERAIAATRIRDNQRFLLIAAAIVLVSLIGVGLVSRQGGPSAESMPTPAVPASFAATAAHATVEVAVHATGQVEVTAVVDGVAQEPVTLRPREVVAYSATEQLELSADDGGLIKLSVGGVALGKPGELGAPWTQTFVATAASPSGSSAPRAGAAG